MKCNTTFPNNNMALLPTKTYSKRNNELTDLSERDKENVDPFDELLSSPLKQDVQFQPLSFWDKKGRNIGSKKKSKTNKCKLYETSDSDEHNSPFQRNRKPKSKNLVSKRALQPKSTNSNLTTGRNNISTACSLIECTKSHMSITPKDTKSFMNAEEFEKNQSRLLNKTLYSNENMEETSKSAYRGCDNFKFDSATYFNIADTTETFNFLHSTQFQHTTASALSYLNSMQSKDSNNKNYMGFINEKMNYRNFNFKVYEYINKSQKQSVDANDETKVSKEKSVDCIMQLSESTGEAVKPFYQDCDSFKFISVKRQFNYPSFYNLPDGNSDSSLNSIEFMENQKYSGQLNTLNASNSSCSSKVKSYEDVSLAVDCVNDSDEINVIDDGDDDEEFFINNTLAQTSNEYRGRTFFLVNSTITINEDSEAIFLKECQDEKTFSDSFDFVDFRTTKLKDLIQELEQNANEQNNVTAEFSSISYDTLSESNDEETVIRISTKPETNPTSIRGFETQEIVYPASASNGVSQLTNRFSDLVISKAADDDLSELGAGQSTILRDDSNCADKENSFLVDLRNVTTKRRGFLNNKFGENVPLVNGSRSRFSAASKKIQKENNSEVELEFDQTLEFPRVIDRMSLDWNKTVSFANPMFESTRVLDMNLTNKKVSQGQNSSETFFEEFAFDHTYVLKPGKKWLRSMSILKQLQNGNISKDRFENTRITGRKFESFVQDIIELQNADSKVSNKTCSGVKIQNSFSDGFSGYQTVLNLEDESEMNEFFPVNNSILTNSTTDKTTSEKVILNRTVKVIQPDEGSSAFRSALGLETSHVKIQEDSAREESSCLSARDFILIQCGQEDVLPFEEYFNERTLINCKKIGEGVYGEVFMCSDKVIKIIPIEGLDKVNGESQKTFEEIISEVVIASKLSDLRNGEEHQTDGFSEMKRCWCVKGKYPKYLLHLWNEYDQLGSGSENDSPGMFKDDQLYIILELANGGKDLESFVFNSAAQSLSLFIQAAFSLAVAEKAFEFEHRDLHWGNLLISETKDKVMTVILDHMEYKIPTKGVKVCIIDFTLSRMNHEGCCIFNDLSVDPGLFASEGDYQFEIYRMMLREVKNDWSLFRPKNNLFWLHYVLDKMIKMVRYKNKKAKVHAKHLKDLKTLESVVLEHKDSANFVLGSYLSNVINKL